MEIKIVNSTLEDVSKIFQLYDDAVAYQKNRYNLHWPAFEVAMVTREISENQQWKLLINGNIACVWATTFSDPLIWGDRNNDPAVYIHRIAVSPNFRGQQLVSHIVHWALNYGKQHHKLFVRLDTVGDNKKLIAHYEKCGFTFLGLSKIADGTGLPAHYYNAMVSLFEIKIE